MSVRVIGMDPSLSNWGIAVGDLDVTQETLSIQALDVIRPEALEGKQVRQNSKDMHRAEQLMAGVLPYLTYADVICVEVPTGSQSASAMKGYGVCMGLLAAMRERGLAFIELTPNDIKLTATNSKTATKQQMIDWAVGEYPDAPWPRRQHKGESQIISAQAEHMADAVAAIRAGLKSAEFRRLLPALRRAA